MKLEVTIQIFSGSFLEEAVSAETFSYEELERKLVSVLARLPVRKVIMGWSVDRKIYEKTAAFLAKRNIDFYLWFPVFSETGGIKNLSLLLDFRGQKIEGRGNHEEEDFAFCCPNDPRNITEILDIFEQNFASIPFKGVFLDRIRYPSFANIGFGLGLKSVFSCFCPNCIEFYKNEGLDIEDVKEALSRPVSVPLGITAYRGGEYQFEDPILHRFFDLKANIILKSLKQICRYFREKGLGIGFDVFAPFLSPFVGQNLKELSGLCDFMKPMMYCATQAPAGLPFETEALLRETGADTPARQCFYERLGLDPEKKPFDLDFAVKELQNLVARSACPVYAGVEINRIENKADVDPAYIEETIKAYASTGIKGIALSWNILNAPEENIAKAAEILD
jgi:hypothetical protein